jgi:hypothetical protein
MKTNASRRVGRTDATHQDATLAVQVGVDLLLKGGLVEVSGADTDTEGDGLLPGLAGHILVNSDRGLYCRVRKDKRSILEMDEHIR